MSDNGTWLDVLGDLTPKALESGMERLKRSDAQSQFRDYPPNPLQFRALCLAFYEELTLPNVGAAFNEIQLNYTLDKHSWSHPVVQYTAQKMGGALMNIEHQQEAFGVFKPIYEQVCHLVKQGHDLPTQQDRSNNIISKSTSVYEREMNKIRNILQEA